MRYSRNPCLNLFSARQSCVLQSALGVIDRHIACIRSRRRKGEWLSGGSEVRARVRLAPGMSTTEKRRRELARLAADGLIKLSAGSPGG